MVSSAFWAFGTKLQIGDGATSESFSDIAELNDIVPPNMTKDSIDITNHSSADRYREFMAGMKDGGTVSFKGNWLPNNATHDENTGVLESFNDDVNHNWRLVLPDSAGTFSFAGHLTSLNMETPLTAQATISGSIKISGKPTFA